MKALTLWQPYAQAIAVGLKRYETRSWSTCHRGSIAIHAAKRPLRKNDLELAERYGLEAVPLGFIVAIAELRECLPITKDLAAQQSTTELDFGDWRPGRYAWLLENIQRLKEPVMERGMQGLWSWTG